MEHATAGFEYLIETIKDGVVIDSEVVHNLIPTEGINYLINAGMKGATAVSSWYIGLYEGSYTPVAGDTASTFPAAATELTAYSEAARQALVLGTVAAGSVDNTASRAQFTGTTNGKLVRGGFVTSAPTKGAATGTLISAVQFSSPKALDLGTILRVTAGFSITSV
jgi:hypothetical protein